MSTVGFNVANGVSSILAHKLGQAEISFAAAGICGAIHSIGMFWRWKMANVTQRELAMLAQLEALQLERFRALQAAMAEDTNYGSVMIAAERKALGVLDRVCALPAMQAHTGQELGRAGVCFSARDGTRFFVDPAHIFRRGIDPRVWDGSTCYQVGDNIPYAEKMATAMLLLHDDPGLFDVWAMNHGLPVSRRLRGHVPEAIKWILP